MWVPQELFWKSICRMSCWVLWWFWLSRFKTCLFLWKWVLPLLSRKFLINFLFQVCKNPCDGSCGVNADCNLRGLTPVCSCPRDMTGDPFISCRKFVPEDLCKPNPCGTNSICTPGHDRSGRERPVCTWVIFILICGNQLTLNSSCPPGYTGNALTSCVRGECMSNEECPNHRKFFN